MKLARIIIMNSFKIIVMIALLSMSNLSLPVYANQSQLFDVLASMSLEELLNVEVISASKEIDSILLAPGTIYVITKEEIERYGFEQLQDALKYVPSVYLYDPHSWVWGGQRGFVSNFSQTLLLLNGREVNNLIALEGFISRQFSTHNIERIEIIAGPASALYGANALAGIVNIITKEVADDYEDIQLGLTNGSFDTRAIDLVFGKKLGDLKLSGSFRNFNSKNDDYLDFVRDTENFSKGWVDADISLNSITDYKSPSAATSYSLQADYKDIYFGIYSYYNKQGHGLETLGWTYTDREDNRAFSNLYGGIDKQFSDNFSLKLEYQHINSKLWGRSQPGSFPGSALESNGNFNLQTIPGSVTTSNGLTLNGITEIKNHYGSYAHYLIDQNIIDGNNISSTDIQQYFTLIYSNKNSRGSMRDRIDLQMNWDISDHSSLIAGYSLDQIDYVGLALTNGATGLGASYDVPVDLSKRKDVYDSSKQGVFLQYKHTFLDSIWLTAGTRYDKQNHYGTTINPRVSVVGQLNKGRIIKFQYGEAFREPNVFELAGNADIEPAKLRAFELSYSDFISDKFHYQVNYYVNRVNNFLASVGSLIGEGVGSVDSQEVKGIEIDSDMFIGDWLLFANASFIMDATQELIASNGTTQTREVLGLPKERFSLGISYHILQSYNLSLLYQFVNRYETVNGSPTISTTLNIGEVNDAKLILSSTGRRYDDLTIKWSLAISNLLDEEYYHADIRRSGGNKFLQDGRSALFRVSFTY